jgi:hypothetical protein
MHIEPARESRTNRLAAAILADRDREKPQHNIIACFSCGATFIYRGRKGELNGRFCSMRCQQWFDDGNPSYEQQQEQERELSKASLDSFVVMAGPPGTVGRRPYAELLDAIAQARGKPRQSYQTKRTRDGYTIQCPQCRKDFESKGLRCCSKDCEKAHGEQEDNVAVLAKAGIEIKAKKLCAECAGRMPVWRNGRRVPSSARFCSDRCRNKAARTRKAA